MKIRRYKRSYGGRGDGPRKRNSAKNVPRSVWFGSLQASNVHERSTMYNAFKRIFPRNRSLEEFCGVSPAPLDCIEFHAELAFTLNMLEDIARASSNVLNAFPLYHGHVLWNCLPRITYADGEYTFSVVHNGPSLSYPPRTAHPTRSPPPVSFALLYLIFNDDAIVSEMVPSAQGDEVVFDKKFRLADFEDAEDGIVDVQIVLYVPPSYFDLATIIDLDALPPTVPDVMARTVATALLGEKPDGADWTITVAERDFFVHGEAFASKSQTIQKALNDGHRCIEKICILPTCVTADDMQVIIPLIYGAAVPFLRDDAPLIPLVNNTLHQVFNADYLKSFLAPQWERAICKRALALPLTVPSFFPAFRLLTIIWCFPRGWMSIAKRVAIGVMADIVHLHAGDDVKAFLHGRAAEIVPLLKEKDLDHWLSIMDSMLMHLYQVSSVLKNKPRNENENYEAEVTEEETDEEGDEEEANPATFNATPSEMVDPLFIQGSTAQVEHDNKIDQVASLKGEFIISFETEEAPDVVKTSDESVKGEEFNALDFTKESKKVPSVEDEEEWHDEDTHGSFNPADPKCKCAIS